MFDVLLARWKQGHHTIRYPAGPAPELPERFAGRPALDAAKCGRTCSTCVEVCPTGAIAVDRTENTLQLDTGRCLFCRECETACSADAITFSQEFRMAAVDRNDLVVRAKTNESASSRQAACGFASMAVPPRDAIRRLLGRSLKLRQVSAGGCNACEADTNVLETLAWDLGRFGIQFVASPRHADGLLITGPVTENMRTALQDTYAAVPSPKIVIAVGACAISGGPYVDHGEVHNGAASIVPIDLFVPGCPPHPLTILHALLAFLGKLPQDR